MLGMPRSKKESGLRTRQHSGRMDSARERRPFEGQLMGTSLYVTSCLLPRLSTIY